MDFNNISPIDSRYQEEAKPLHDYFTEEANIRYMLGVELALLCEHCKRHEIRQPVSIKVKAQDVYEEEQKTHHQVKALVNLIQKQVPDQAKPFVHLGVTSSDICDTAIRMAIYDAMQDVILPKLQSLENALVTKMLKYRHTEQIGRTHGQYAIPMTMGWWWAGYVSRIGRAIRKIDASIPRAGQMSGAVGTYSALSYIYPDPVEFSKSVLHRLQMAKAEYSSQIIPADSMVRFLSEVNICFGVLANLADDIRNLQRSEIGEVREVFTDKQVGSSTMPQKRNPWNCEHVKSLWKEYMPRYITFNMDLISEHQRDLTNSASSRFIPEYLTGFYLAVSRACDIVEGLQVNEDKMAERTQTGTAEKAYILLALSGTYDAHEAVRRLTIIAEKNNVDFETALMQSDWWERVRDRWYDIPADPTQKIIDGLADKYKKDY
jgi:adenylosuccinate lyase